MKQLLYHRKVYVFVVERFDVLAGCWEKYGTVLLPDNAFRHELAHALRVFGLRIPRGTDRVIWDYDAAKWSPDDPRSPLPRPRGRIINADGRPLVRLAVLEKKKLHELGLEKPRG
jgi:hypothetical protein